MNENNKKLDWKPAFEIFSRISTWIIVPIILALIFGKMLDTYYGTKPIMFLILAGLGFLFSCVGIIHVVKNYMKKLKEISSSSYNITIDKEKK